MTTSVMDTAFHVGPPQTYKHIYKNNTQRTKTHDTVTTNMQHVINMDYAFKCTGDNGKQMMNNK